MDMVVGNYMVVVVAVDMHVRDKRCEVLPVDRTQVDCTAPAHKVQEPRRMVGDMNVSEEHNHCSPAAWQVAPELLEAYSTATTASLD